MKTLLLLLVLFPRFICAADEDQVREPFALYPVTRENTAEATPFIYFGAVDRKPHTGHFMKSAVLTLADIKNVKRDTTEIMSAPFSGLSFQLSLKGLARLQAYLKKPQSGELVVIIDGHPYATVDVVFLRQLVKSSDPLLVIFPGPYEDTTNHLLQLLLEKIRAALKAAGTNSLTADEAKSKPSPKP
jgi:hypothetical protein